MQSTPDSKIQALLRLLSDPNEHIARTIQDQLVRIGPSTLPHLKKAREEDTSLEPRIAYVTDEIRFEKLKEEFFQFASHNPTQQLDWEQGAFLIAKLAYPDLPTAHYQQCLDHLADEFRATEPYTSLSSAQTTQLLTIFLFQKKGFSGNRTHYYDPDNSYMNRVIECRQGIPITLSALLVFVGNRLGLPLAGVGMPGHFLVKIEEGSPSQFVDCFNDGTLLREQGCRQFITASGLDYHPQFLEKSSTRLILVRMLRNLQSIYDQEQQESLSKRIGTLIEMLNPTPLSDH